MLGDDLKPGDDAPEFSVQTLEWAPFKGLADTPGKVRIIAALLSLDTDVCDRETHRFNQEAAALSKDIAILVISTDLPFHPETLVRCGRGGPGDRSFGPYDGDFGLKYGCLIKEVRFLRRAVFVVDRAGKITYAAYMPALGDEPNYAEVLAAAQAAL